MSRHSWRSLLRNNPSFWKFELMHRVRMSAVVHPFLDGLAEMHDTIAVQAASESFLHRTGAWQRVRQAACDEMEIQNFLPAYFHCVSFPWKVWSVCAPSRGFLLPNFCAGSQGTGEYPSGLIGLSANSYCIQAPRVRHGVASERPSGIG